MFYVTCITVKKTLKENINGSVRTLFSTLPRWFPITLKVKSKVLVLTDTSNDQYDLRLLVPWHRLHDLTSWNSQPHSHHLHGTVPQLVHEHQAFSHRTSPCSGFSLCLKHCDLDIHVAPSLTSFKSLLKGHLIGGMFSAYLNLLYFSFFQHII